MFHVEHLSNDLVQLFLDGAKSLGITLDTRALRCFSIYLSELKEWNQAFNLTSIKEDRDIVIKHFLDSLSAAPFLRDTRTLLDIGAGAGFPGVPLKISLDHLAVVLAESSLKKVRFLQHIIHLLELRDIFPIHRHIGWKKGNRKKDFLFDAVISRGTLSLRELLMIGTYVLHPGGNVVWMYSSRKKVDAALNSLPEDVMHIFDIQFIHSFSLPFANLKRTITFFQMKS